MATNGIKEIKVSNTNYLIEPTLLGTCGTAANTAIKDVTLSNFELFDNVQITVKFTTTNTAAVSGLKLRVNSSNENDAKPIKYRGGNLPAVGTLTANHIYNFVYDGTNWELVGDLDTNTDRLVEQGVTSTGSWRKLLLNGGNVYSAKGTTPTNRTDVAYQATNLDFQPSTGTLVATKFSGDGSALTSLTATNIIGTVPFSNLPTGTDADKIAIGNHNHDGVYAPAAHTHNLLVPFASISDTTVTTASQKTAAGALKEYFNNYKTIIPRNKLISFVTTAYSNALYAMGHFIEGYNDGPYGGFFVAHYQTPRYVGISNGSYEESILMRYVAGDGLVSGEVLVANGASGKVKTTGYTIAKSVPADAVFTDHYDWEDITSKPATATRWPTWSEVTEKPTSFTPAEHNHHTDRTLMHGYTRANIGTSPNYDNPQYNNTWINGLYEIRAASEVSGQTGTRPAAGYYPMLSLRTEHVMMQLGGVNSQGWFIRGTQASNPTLAGIAWQKLITDANYKSYAWARPSSITDGQVLISSGNAGETTLRGIRNNTSGGALGWTANATDITLITTNTLAYWNGRYNNSNSNLEYYKGGAFGTMAKETAADYAKLASPAFSGTPTAPTAANGTSTTQIATTEFVNNTLAYANAMTFKGTLGTGGTITALPASHNAGDTYRVITAGTWAGKYCEIGTLIICTTDGTAANDADWTSVETNEDGAVIGPASSTENSLAFFSSTSGRVLDDTGTYVKYLNHIAANAGTNKAGYIDGLHITGAAYGEAANLISNVAGKMSYGDAGAQIRFTCSGQNGAMIFNHYDNTTPSSTFAASFNFVTDQGNGVALKSDGFIINGTTTWLRDNNLIFSQGGGWCMTDATWIRTVGSKSVYMNAGTFRNDGTTQLRLLQHVNTNIAVDGTWQTGATGTAGDGTNAGTLGTSILSIGNNIAQSTTDGAGKNNAAGYLRIYNTGTSYAELAAYSTYTYATTGLALKNNVTGILFRPDSSTYHVHISHQTNGNEALVAATQNAVTSFIFINGEALANISNSRWQSLTPALQIKNNSVYIGELIPHGITPSYKFKVNGTSYFADIVNIIGDTNAQTGKGIDFILNDIKYGHIGTSTGGNIGIYGNSGVIIRPSLTATNRGIKIEASAITPGETNQIDLGASNNVWKNVYATTFNGNATTATTSTWTTLLKPINTTTTASASTWSIPSGSYQVWGERFSDTRLKYTPEGGSESTVTDTGDWTMWLTSGGTSNVATLNMRIDGTYYGSFSGNLSGNATTATSASALTQTQQNSANLDESAFKTNNLKVWYASGGNTITNYPTGFTSSEGAGWLTYRVANSYYGQLFHSHTNHLYIRTIGSNHTDWAEILHTDNYSSYALPLTGGQISGQITKAGVGKNWNKGRDGALIAITSLSSYSTLASMKTVNGSWDIGSYSDTNYTDDLLFTYISDTHYNGSNTVDAQIRFLENGHVIATLDGTASKANLLNSSTTANTAGLQYYSGQPTIGSADGNAYEGSSNSYKLWSYPADYTAHTTVANIQTIRAYWGSSYFHDIFMSPNNENLLHRSVLNNSAKDWRVILDSANYDDYALPLSGGTMTGALNFANNTWNKVGDDVYLGDINKGGHIGIQGINGNTGIFFTTYNQTAKLTGASLSWDGTYLISDKTIKMPSIIITNTGAINHIDFSRTGGHNAPNYINVPASSSLAFTVGGAGEAQIAAMIDSDGIVPFTTNTKSIGTSTHKWNAMYATTFNGDLVGNAATANMASFLSTPSITTEENIESGTRAYQGSGSGWTGSISSMQYAGILQVCGGYSRGWQIWAQRGDNATQSLHWRNPNTAANAWNEERIILDSGNYTGYTVTKTGTGASGTWGISITGSSASCTGNAATATKAGVAGIWLYPENNNEINFGGTNTNTTLYVGYRAKDSRAIPTKFIFGSSTGTADLQAKTVYLGSGTTSYVSSTQYTGNAATASKISAKLAATTKTYLLGTSTAITATAANVDITGDTGVYLTTTAGELSAARHSWNVSGTEKAYTIYNTTDDSIDFVFI